MYKVLLQNVEIQTLESFQAVLDTGHYAEKSYDQ